MPNLGSLFYTLGIKDMTDQELQRISTKLRNIGYEINLTPKIITDALQSTVPKGIQIELTPTITNEALNRAAQNKVMEVAVKPLITTLRKEIKDATSASPAEIALKINEAQLRNLVTKSLNSQGFMINISTANDNYSRVIQQKLNGTTYSVKIHADAREITRSVMASLMQVESRNFGLRVSRDILHKSIEDALMGRRFNIEIAVSQNQARMAVQNALMRAQVIGKDQALAYQRLQTGELRAAQAELQRLKAAQLGASDAAKSHSSATADLNRGFLQSNQLAAELGSTIAGIYSVHAIREFASQIIEIGGELEHQKIAMDTIFGDKGLTIDLFGKIKTLSRNSPFGVMELTKSAKALSAYGVEYSEIYDTAKRLADISAATSVDINRLILAFGKTKSRGFLDGLEAKQFAYANIPIYELVRKKLEELEGQAITTAEVMSRMKKREISFDIVKSVLWDTTNEGGKFYDMQDALAGSLKTSWKLVRDNIELMFGDMAESGIGSALKSTAEILQVATQKWRMLGSVVVATAGVYGIYKVAMMMANTIAGRGIAVNLAQKSAQASLNASVAQTAQMYRGLSAEEHRSIALKGALQRATSILSTKKNALTSADIRLLVAEKMLNRDMAARMIALGKISPMQARYLIQQGLITTADLRAATAAGRHAISLNLFGKTLSIHTLRFRLLGAAMKQSLGGIASTLMNPLTLAMTAIGGIVAAYQRYKGEMDAVAEVGKTISTQAAEGVNSINSAIDGIKSSSELSSVEITRNIEKMTEAIKTYSVTPIADMNDAFVAQDGHVRTLAERHDALLATLKNIATAYREVGDAADANSATSIVTWATEMTGGFFSDTVLTNAKDLTEAYAAQEDALSEYITKFAGDVAKAVKVAADGYPKFRDAIEGIKTTEAQFRELMRTDDAGNPIYKIGFDVAKYRVEHSMTNVIQKGNVASQLQTFNDDVELQIKSITSKIKEMWDVDVADMSDAQKNTLALALSKMINSAEGVSESVKARWAKLLEDAFGVTIMDDKIAGVWQESFSEAASKATDAAAKAAVLKLKYEGYDKLSDAQKKLIDKLYNDATTDTKAKLPDMWTEVQSWLSGHDLKWKISLAVSGDKQPKELAAELVKARGITGLTEDTDRLLNQWATSGSALEMRNAAQESLSNAYNERKAAERWGKDSTVYKNAEKNYQMVRNAIDYAGWGDIQVKDEKSNKHKNEKDTLAEQLKHRLDNLKKAYAEYEKNLNVMSRTESMNSIKESGLFDELFTGEDAIENFDDYKGQLQKAEASIAGMAETDKRFKGRHDIVLSLRTLLNLEIPRDKAKEELNRAKREIDDVISKTTDKWNLFQDLFSASGDTEWSLKTAWSNPMYLDDATRELERELQKAKWRKGFTEYIPITLEVEDARELFGQQNEDLFNLWKAIRERAMSGGRDAAKSEAEAMRKYLNNYESYHKRRLAIEEEYATKIAIARDKGNKQEEKNLINERDALKMGLEVDAVKQTVDWGSVLGSFGEIFNTALKPTLDHLTAITKTEGFKNATIEERQKVYDAISELKKSDESWGGRQMFADLAADMERYQTSMRELIAAQDRLRNAEANLASAKERLQTAKKGGNEDAIASAGNDVDAAQKAFDVCAESVNAFSRSAQDASNGVKDSAAKMSKDLSGLAGALSGLKSGSVKSAGEGLMAIDKLFNNGAATKAIEGGVTKLFAGNKVTSAIGKAFEGLPMGEIISGILAIMDVMKDGIGPIIGSLLDTILGAVNGILKDIFQPQKMFMMIWEPLSANLSSILDTVTFGGFSSWTDGNGAAVARSIDALNRRNETLQYAIEGLTSSMDKEHNSFRRAKKASDALQLQEEYNNNILKKAAKQASYWGAHSSWNKAWEGLSGNLLSKASDLIGRNWDGNFWNLTPEEMKVILSVPDIVDRIQETNYGNRLIEHFKEYADQAEKLEEIKNQLYEASTGVTFDSMYDSFVDTLMDMEASAEDFADKFSEYLMRAMLMQTIGDQLSEQLDTFYKQFGEASSKGKLQDEQTRKSLEEMWDSIVKQGMEIRDNLAKATGYKGSSSDSKGLSAGISSITEDTADLLASYVNSIRSFVHESTLHMRDCSDGIQQIIHDAMPKISAVAESQLRVQEQIATNTQITADGVTAIMSILQRNINGANKFHIS